MAACAAPARLDPSRAAAAATTDSLRKVDLNRLTPLEALNLLAELKKQLD